MSIPGPDPRTELSTEDVLFNEADTPNPFKRVTAGASCPSMGIRSISGKKEPSIGYLTEPRGHSKVLLEGVTSLVKNFIYMSCHTLGIFLSPLVSSVTVTVFLLTLLSISQRILIFLFLYIFF